MVRRYWRAFAEAVRKGTEEFRFVLRQERTLDAYSERYGVRPEPGSVMDPTTNFFGERFDKEPYVRFAEVELAPLEEQPGFAFWRRAWK